MSRGPYAVKVNAEKAGLWKGGGPLLKHIDVELTERCNNRCAHCYINLPAGDRGARRRELPADGVIEVLREAAGLGALSVRFTGGEPLLRPDFDEIYVAARRLGMRVKLYTNACLVTPRLADLFARVPPLEPIEVSVYGMTETSYDAVSGVRGSFARFRRGVALLLERGVRFIVKGTLLPATRGETAAFEEWAASIPGADGPPGYVMFLYLRGRRDSAAKNRRIARLRLSPDEGARWLARDRAAYRDGMREFVRGFMRPSGARLFDCGAGEDVTLDAYGTLQPCLTLRHPEVVYDLSSGSLKHALTEFFPRLRERTATNPEYVDRCARCFLTGLCDQCPARSWMEHGTLDTPVEYLCEVAHAQARELGLLREGERAWEIDDWKERITWI